MLHLINHLKAASYNFFGVIYTYEDLHESTRGGFLFQRTSGEQSMKKIHRLTRILLIAVMMSTLQVGLAISREPMYCGYGNKGLQ